MKLKPNSFLALSRVIFLLYLSIHSVAGQWGWFSQSSNLNNHYANLYGTEPFNSTMLDNFIGISIGGIKFIYNYIKQQYEAQPDMTPENNSKYDFIVIGAGTAGATIASRLTEDPTCNVLLIEAGQEENLIMDIPVVANFLQYMTGINWAYTTEPSDKYCRGMIDRKCRWPRGRVMGGSSVLNYLIATRANEADYDHWAELGNDGWAYKDVLKYFKKLESIQIPKLKGDTENHGTHGPVSIDHAHFRSPMLEAFLKGGEEMGYPVLDYNGEKQIGFAPIQSTMYQGYRMSSNGAYLRGKNRPNLHVTKYSMVHRILIDKEKKQAIGVEFVKDEDRISVYANKEVILSAGAIGSPQLLMLSGIGPAEHLQELGIDVVKDARVGDNLMDHIAYGGLTFTTPEPATINFFDMIDVIRKPYFKDFLLNNRGPLTVSGGCEGIAFLDLDNPDNKDGLPNMELLSLAGSIYTIRATVNNFGLNDEIRDKTFWLQTKYTWGAFPMILRPKSKGWIRLKSKDVNVHPIIVPNYMSDPDDVRVLVKGIRAVMELSKTKPMQDLRLEFYNVTVDECEKYPFDSDEYWECNLRTITLNIYHYSGTCKMGPENDDTAVVDPTLKVHGVKGLRVADASIMPEIPSAHTNIPTYMIAEKLADMVKEEWGYKSDVNETEDLEKGNTLFDIYKLFG